MKFFKTIVIAPIKALCEKCNQEKTKKFAYKAINIINDEFSRRM